MTDHVWGIDPAISHISFAFADLTSDRVEVETLTCRTEDREGARLGFLDRQVRLYATQAARRYPPACAWVEQPSGRGRNLQLIYAIGVIQAALFEALAAPVWTIPSSRWKRATIGPGNATKQQVAAWVRTHQFAVDSQDEADAVAIAVAGRAMVQQGQWEAAA